MRLRFYRFFLTSSPQQMLPMERDSKESLLDQIFKWSINFNWKRGTELAYRCQFHTDKYVFAGLWKRSTTDIISASWSSFEQSVTETWPYCKVFIDLNENPETWFTIAFEHDPVIFGDPLIQLRSLADNLNPWLYHSGYTLSFNPITQTSDFWTTIRSNAGRIESLSFTFASPNLFQGEDALNEDLRMARDTFNSMQTKITISNENWDLQVPEENPFITSSVAYASDGGWEYEIKVRWSRNKITKSWSMVKSANVNDAMITEVEIRTNNPDAFITAIKEVLWFAFSE